jgi:hypothetical protein
MDWRFPEVSLYAVHHQAHQPLPLVRLFMVFAKNFLANFCQETQTD